MILLDEFEQARRKVEASGGGGGGEAVFGIDGLVVVRVAQEFFDIGRGGHGADLGEGGAQV